MLRDRLNDAGVRLVQHIGAHILFVDARVLQRLLNAERHGANRKTEHFLTVHVQEMVVRVRATGEVVSLYAVRAERGAEDISLRAVLGRLEHHSADRIAEEHAGGSVLPVDIAGHKVAADDQSLRRETGTHESLRRPERVEKARARRVDVESDRIRRADFRLNPAGCARRHIAVRAGADDDEADFLGGDTGHFEGPLRRLLAEALDALRLIGDMPLPYAGAGINPLVARLNDLCEIIIRHYFFRQGGTRAGNPELHASPYAF